MENDLLRPINYNTDYARQNLRLTSIEVITNNSEELSSLSAEDNFTFVNRYDNNKKNDIYYVYDHNNNDDDDNNDDIPYAVPDPNNNVANNMSNKSYPKPIVGIN